MVLKFMTYQRSTSRDTGTWRKIWHGSTRMVRAQGQREQERYPPLESSALRWLPSHVIGNRLVGHAAAFKSPFGAS
jgi:hypothetical protein